VLVDWCGGVPAQPPAEPDGVEAAPASPSFGSWARYVIGR